jgi:Sep-tRNA:Cys-tRNA synthetase
MALSNERLRRFEDIRRENYGLINLNPIQRGGILTPAAREVLNEWGDGYSVCDFCEGCIHDIKKPPIDVFTKEILPEFLEIDSVRVTNGAREGKYLVMHSLCEKGDSILLDGNAHYSTYVAAERAGLIVHAVPNLGAPEYKIDAEKYAELIDSIKPKLAVLTYPDGSYGNVPDATRVGKICREKGVPFMINGAYSVGRMPVSAKKLNADFIVASGHKSMAACGPIGLLGAGKEYADKVFRKSEKYKKKELELLGCSARGLPLITLMASFPSVVERVGRWDNEVKNARHFSSELEKIGGIRQWGEKPHNHDLMSFESEAYYKISERHKKSRFFLYSELKDRGIVGLKPGITKNFKVSTYGLTEEELQKVIDAFTEIAKL